MRILQLGKDPLHFELTVKSRAVVLFNFGTFWPKVTVHKHQTLRYTKILRINVVKLHDGELVDGGRQFLTLFEKKSGASRRSLAHKTAASVLSREQLLFRALRLVTTLFCHNAEVTCEVIHKLSQRVLNRWRKN